MTNLILDSLQRQIQEVSGTTPTSQLFFPHPKNKNEKKINYFITSLEDLDTV